MSREIAERCDLCGQFRPHGDLVTVHALGEPVDVCSDCQAKPVGNVLAEARGRTAAVLKVESEDHVEPWTGQ